VSDVRWKLALRSGCLLLVAGCAPQPEVTAKDSTSNCQWRDNQHYDATILDKLGYRYEADRSPPGHNGEGTFTFRYRAKQAGTMHLALEESDNGYPAHVCRQFTLDVTVR
jgi:hypothetical protein